MFGTQCIVWNSIRYQDSIWKPSILPACCLCPPVWTSILIRCSHIPSYSPTYCLWPSSWFLKNHFFYLSRWPTDFSTYMFLYKNDEIIHWCARKSFIGRYFSHKSVVRSSFSFHVVMTSKPNPQVSVLFSLSACYHVIYLHICYSLYHIFSRLVAFVSILQVNVYSFHPHNWNPFSSFNNASLFFSRWSIYLPILVFIYSNLTFIRN